MQLASWLWMSANSLSRKDFFSCLPLKIEDENRVHKDSQRSSLDPPPHSPPIPAPSHGSRPSWNTAHLGHGWDMSIKGWRCCAFSRVKQLGGEKKVFSSAAFSFFVPNTSVAWSYSSLYRALIAEAQHLSPILLTATWASSSCAAEKHLLNEAAMRSMLYDFQEQNSLQLAEGLVFDSFLWLFYNCLQIFSSFKLFWKVLGRSQKLFCASMCLLAWIQESF